MKKNKSTSSLIPLILGLCLIAVGAAVFFFPKVRFALFNREAKAAREEFGQVMQSADKSGDGEIILSPELQALYERLVEENQALYRYQSEGIPTDYVKNADTVHLADYGIEDSIIGYVTIEKLNVTLPIVIGEASDENMRIGAVNLPETSYPVGGINTNAVLAAHRGSTIGAMFRNIHLLEPGDEVVIENFREKMVYRMVRYKIIEPDENEYLDIQEGKDMITLYSCHPLGQNKQRLLVYCERVTE